MAKSKQTSKKTALIPEKYQDIFYISILVLAIVVFFKDAIFGGSFGVSDNLASLSFQNFRDNAAKNGEFPLWIPQIFGGMPAYESLLLTGERTWDFIARFIFGITEMIGDIFNSDAARVSVFYMIYAVGIYFLLKVKNHSKLVSFISSFAAVFSTGIVIWIMIGHNTKPVVFAFLPYVFLSMEKLKDKFSLLYSVIAAISLHMMFEGAHIQMLFYSACMFVIYYAVEITSAAVGKSNLSGYLRSAGVMLIVAGIAFAMSSDRYLASLDYTEHSTRGSAPTLASEEEKEQNSDGGNPYDYATQWSFSPGEVMTFFVPAYYGHGELEFDVKDAEPGSLLARISPMVGGKFRTYWGQKPFEDAPPYMGIIVLLFGLFGIFRNWKDNFVKFLTIVSVFALFLSFGYTLSFLFDFFYYNIPLFNKFRAPSMALAIIHFSFPILAAYGFSSALSTKKEDLKSISYQMFFPAIAFMILGLIMKFVAGGFFKSMINTDPFMNVYGRAVQGQTQLADQMLSEYQNWMHSVATTDWIVAGLVATLAVGLIINYVNRKINLTVFSAAMIILIMIDLWRVDYRNNDPQDKRLNESFVNLDWVNEIKKDPEKFRVAPMVFQSPNQSSYYGLESVNGYSSTKLRVYQDLLDVASGGSTSSMMNPFMWSLLNVKYVIDSRDIPGYPVVYTSQSQPGVKVMRNPNYLPRVIFTNNVEVLSAKDILLKYQDPSGYFNPFENAFVEEELETKIEKTDSTAKAIIKDYKNEYVSIETKTPANNFMVLSEIYYAPGWKAYIDGVETKIYKTNFAFRGVIVPKGEHKIEFKYTSKGFETGKNLSLASNILILLSLIGGLYIEQRKKKNEES